MIKPNDLWKNATQIAAGRFAASKYVTDLIVRWVDGELTLYTNVSAADLRPGAPAEAEERHLAGRHAPDGR